MAETDFIPVGVVEDEETFAPVEAVEEEAEFTPVAEIRPAREALEEKLKKANLYGSATSAFGEAWDKEIRRNEDGSWDLPTLSAPTGKLGVIGDVAIGLENLASQKLGKRSSPDAPQYQEVQNIFHTLQQENNLSDDEVKAAWQDLGNINRPWEDDEKTRVLSDGRIEVNPNAPELLDAAKGEALIDSVVTSDEEKAAAKANLPRLQTNYAGSKLEGYEAAANAVKDYAATVNPVNGDAIGEAVMMESPSQWATKNGRTDFGTPQFVADYEKEVIDTQNPAAKFTRGIATDWVLGLNKLATTVLGVGGAVGNDTMADAAIGGSEAAQVINQGKEDTGLAGTIVQEIPSITAQILTGRLLGVVSGATGSVAAAEYIPTIGTFATAGAQSAGMTYADERASGKSHEEAQSDALKTGISTALITAAFQKLGAGAVEQVAVGKKISEVTLRDLLKSASKEELRTNLKTLAGGVAKSYLGEGAEEGADQLVSAFLTADPDTNLASAWDNAVEAFKVGGVIGGAVDVAASAVSPEIRQSETLIAEAAPLAPESAAAAAEIQPETETTDEPNTPLDVPVPEVPGGELLSETAGSPVASEVPIGEAPLPTGDGSIAPEAGNLPIGTDRTVQAEIPTDTLNENETTDTTQTTIQTPEITAADGSVVDTQQTEGTGIRDGSLEEGPSLGAQQTLNTNENETTTTIPDAAAQPVSSGDPDTVAFPEDSGTLGIPRAEMPQIKAENRGAMVQFLGARGIPSSEETIAPSELKPSQVEYSQERVDAAKAFTGGDRAILISADNHVIDGHHQWVADLQENPDTPIRVIRLNAPAVDVIEAVRQMPSVTTDDSLGTTPPPTGTSVPTDLPSNTAPPSDPTFAGDFATEEREREAKGLPPAPIVEKWTEKGAWESALAAEANQKAQNIPTTAGSALFDRLLAEGKTTLTPEEHALMVHEIMVRDQTVSRTYTDLANLPIDVPPGVRQSAQAAMKKAQGEYDDIWTYMHRVGSAAGSALRARQMQVNMDFSLASMMRNARAKLNQNSAAPLDLSEEQKAEVSRLHDAIRQGEAREEALQGDVSELNQMVEQLTKDVEAAQKKAANRDLKSKSKIKKILDPRVEEAKRRLLERGRITLANALKPDEGKVYSGVSNEVLEDLRDVSILAAGWLVEKAYDLAEFTNKLGRDIGSWALEHAEKVYGDAQQIYHETAESVEGRQAPRAEDIIAALDGSEPLDRRTVFQLARANVIAGKRGNNVLDAVYDALLPTYPDLTRDQVATLFTDYGKVTYPSKEEIPQELSRIRNLERIALKLQDLRAGKPPLRTGFQRGEQDAEIRELEKQFRQELKDSGLVVEDPQAQLQTALGAAKRRMENEIEELQRALDRGQPRTANTSTLAYDEEALALRSELEAKREEYAAAFDKGVTPEQRIEQIIKSLDRQIAEEDKMLADGVLKRPKGEPIPSDPDIEERRRILAEKRQNRRDLYEAANPGETALEQAKNSVVSTIERLQKIVDAKTISAKAKKKVNSDEELRALLDVREALQDQVDEIRRALPITPERQARQIQQALESSQKALSRLEVKIARNDLSKTPAKVTAASLNDEVQASQAQVSELNKVLTQMRKDSGLFAPTEAVRLERQIKSIQKRSEELRRRIREKDTSRKPKPATLVSEELRRERYENDKLKAEFSELTGKLVLQGSIGARIKFAALGSANVIKVLTLSGDLGVFLRQLGTTYAAGVADASMFSRLAIPGTRAKAQAEYQRRGSRLANVLKVGTRAFFDESVEHTIYEQIRTRPGAEFDNVGGTKAHFAPPFDTFDSSKEDIPRADLIKIIPWWIWPTLVGVKWAAFGMSPPLAVGLIAASALRKPAMLALDRAQRSMTNASRAAWLDEMRFHASLDGTKTLTPDDHSLMNNAIMVATGRGQIKALDNTVPTLNYLLNAPRFYFSRLQAMTLQPLLKGALGGDGHTAAAQTRKEIAKMYGLSVSGRAIVLVMAALMLGKSDDEEEDLGFVWNPYSPDFGRLRINENVKLDTMSGFNGFMSITARYMGKKRLEKDGTYTVLGGGFSNNVNQELMNFLSTKRNILLSFVANVHARAFFGGKKVTAESALEQATTAIITNDLLKVYQELGPVRGTAFATMMFGGAGTVVRPNEDELLKLKEDRTAIRLEEAERESKLNEGRDENSGVIKF